MTTSIMNKITAALRLNSSLESSPNHSDSKKNDGQDEYHTLFTKRLQNASNLGNMNSTICNEINEFDHHNQSAYSLDDFIGGPIDDENSFNLETNHEKRDQNVDYNRSITATPADSSCGFHNTFSVLEMHLNKTKYLKLSPKQIECLLLQNKDLAVHNDTYIDIPINDNRSLHAVNGLFNSSMNDVKGLDSNDEECPSHLELELEAIDRLRSMWNEEILTNIQIENDKRKSSPTPFDSSLIEEFYQQDNRIGVQNSNEYIYHVAKTRDGQLYIRVRRNLQLDKGKYNIAQYFFNSFPRNNETDVPVLLHAFFMIV